MNETRDVALSETTTAIPPLPHDICRSDAQCLNGGTCQIFKPGQIKSGINDEYNYCICRNGYGGRRCEAYCPLQCSNGGICHPKSAMTGSVKIHDPNPYVCQCLGHYTGMLCDIPFDNCADGSQCYYGGICREREETISVNYCECPPGRVGDSCQDEISTSAFESDHRAFTKDEVKYISLGIVFGMTAFFGVGLILMRRRRRRNELRYKKIQIVEDDCQSEIETNNIRTKRDERWRNIV
jgi:hypothetical protein